MERQILHSTEAVWDMLAREEWLGCRHDASPMVNIPGSTPVWAQYMYFFIFNTKSIRIMFSKIYILWKDTGGSWRCLGSMTIRERFWSPMMFFFYIWMENPQIYHYWFLKTEIDLHNCFIHSLLWFHVKLIVYLSTTEHMVCSHSYCFLFTG